jgi:trehalose 6-phosphate synthase/phosphatase
MSDLRVAQGHKVVEVRPSSLSKGSACQAFLAQDYDFVLAMGDDTTTRTSSGSSPRPPTRSASGLTQSYARFNVRDQAAALSLVEDLAAVEPDRTA